eukprot:TRINITY_DN1411_c0_g1_i1.p1 TRINITY_DN1411_c0_g1~~TRINITY_DN1411_c0_g1_i1.p1  ORF type:complete len:246 (+),score=36.80 TRINITY_DN1411_c0_g1_i1:104-841(+)
MAKVFVDPEDVVKDWLMQFNIDSDLCGHKYSLSINNNDVEELPVEFGFGLGSLFINLIELRLVGNKLQTLPQSFGNLTMLKYLEVKYNFTEFPSPILELSSLETLLINENKLLALPDDIDRLSSLLIFNCSNNELTELPRNIGNILSLKTLNIKMNKIEKLPDNFGNLSKLEHLYITNNLISELPESFFNLLSLKRMFLYDNNITTVSENFSKLTSLRVIKCDHDLVDPFKQITNNVKIFFNKFY